MDDIIQCCSPVVTSVLVSELPEYLQGILECEY